MVMARQSDGKWIPLDPGPPIYKVVLRHDGVIWCERAADMMVTHYATCPGAKQASREAKERKKKWVKPQDYSGG